LYSARHTSSRAARVSSVWAAAAEADASIIFATASNPVRGVAERQPAAAAGVRTQLAVNVQKTCSSGSCVLPASGRYRRLECGQRGQPPRGRIVAWVCAPSYFIGPAESGRLRYRAQFAEAEANLVLGGVRRSAAVRGRPAADAASTGETVLAQPAVDRTTRTHTCRRARLQSGRKVPSSANTSTSGRTRASRPIRPSGSQRA
jgi:hypothetical protein